MGIVRKGVALHENKERSGKSEEVTEVPGVSGD